MIERDGGGRMFFDHSGPKVLFDASTADLGRAWILHAGAPGIDLVMDRCAPAGRATAARLAAAGPGGGPGTNLDGSAWRLDRTTEVARPCLPGLTAS